MFRPCAPVRTPASLVAWTMVRQAQVVQCHRAPVQRQVVARESPALPGRDGLVVLEAEDRHLAEAAERTAAVGATVRLRDVLDDRDAGPARLRACCALVLEHAGAYVREMLGSPDDLKLRSSMTLFGGVAPDPAPSHRVLEAFFGGERCGVTRAVLEAWGVRS